MCAKVDFVLKFPPMCNNGKSSILAHFNVMYRVSVGCPDGREGFWTFDYHCSVKTFFCLIRGVQKGTSSV